MAITRRQFLKRTGLATAGTLLGPSLFGNPFVRQAFADTIGDRYFVVIFLDGGNDGLNTVIPVDNGSGALRSALRRRTARTGGGGISLLAGATLAGTAHRQRSRTPARQLGAPSRVRRPEAALRRSARSP